MKDLLVRQIKEARMALSKHEVICFPTETVMGLGVYFDDYDAYQRLNTIKERPEDKPYTMMVKDINEIEKYAFIDEKIKRVIDRFMPGSITLLLKAKDIVPSYVTHNTGVIGIRIPSNKEALELLKELDKPLLVPSANKSGQKAALNVEEAKSVFQNEINVYISGSCTSSLASTIVNLSKDEPQLIRQGPISFDAIKCVYNGYKYEETVIGYIFDDNDNVLMLYRDKKENDINKNKWIGVGGHIEKGEGPEEAVIREIKEETTIDVLEVSKKAVITFFFKEDVEVMHVFTINNYQGTVGECNEGTLKWIPINKLFDIPLWEGDKLFLKPIINNEPYFEMEMRYDGDSLVNYRRIK